MNQKSSRRTSGFHVLAKPIGPICNLDCRYCFYLEKEKLYPDTTGRAGWALPWDLLESYIRQYIEAQPMPAVSFAWQGGEPTLLGVDYFRRVVELEKKHAGGKRIENGFQTNGILLDDAWCEFLAENRFLVGLSIDGPCKFHDKYRLYKGGRATFGDVMRGLELLKKHAVEFNTLTVVQRHNSYHPLEVYNFLKDAGSGFMQFIPIVERIGEHPAPDGLVLLRPDSSDAARVSEWSVEPMQFGKFLGAIFDEWVHKDVGKYYVQLFDVALEAWLGMEPSLCVFRRTCGDAMVIEHNGDIYSCDHYVYPENRLGNIMESPLLSIVESARQRKFGQDKLDALPRYCRECDVRFACNGECPKHRFTSTPEGERGLNYLCAGYKHFFRHIDPCMRFMAAELREERPPANVMAWIQEQDMRASGKRRVGRNDPCPCGSGGKFKRCCGREV